VFRQRQELHKVDETEVTGAGGGAAQEKIKDDHGVQVMDEVDQTNSDSREDESTPEDPLSTENIGETAHPEHCERPTDEKRRTNPSDLLLRYALHGQLFHKIIQ